MKPVCLLLILLFVAVSATAQSGRLSGRILDSSGAVVAGAEITLVGPANTRVATTKSGADGSFTINAPFSSYALQVTASGFDPSVEGVSIGSSNMPITMTLSVAKITQQVNVEENREFSEPRSAKQSDRAGSQGGRYPGVFPTMSMNSRNI